MKTIQDDLIRDEGRVLHAYTDSEGYLTIGIGRLIDKRRGGGISPEEALYLLNNDLRRVTDALDAKLPWWRQLSPVRQKVLVNMCFNLGMPGLLRFKKTLPAVESGRYKEAAQGMLNSLWARQVGKRAQRLARMMETGEDV